MTIARVQLPLQGEGIAQGFDTSSQRALDRMTQTVRTLAEGRLYGLLAMAAAPSAGSWGLGDVVRNTAPSKVTGGAFNYVLYGWICTVAGTPGTWEELRIPCA